MGYLMSTSDWTVRNFPKAIKQEFLDRCDQEGKTTTQVLEAWVRRAIRQERTIMPEARDTSHKVLLMRGAK